MAGAVAHLGSHRVTLGGVALDILPRQNVASLADKGAVGYDGSFETQESSLRLERRDVTVITGHDLRKGMGIIRRRTSADEGGFGWGEDVRTHDKSGPQPAGRRQTLSFAGLSDGGTALSGTRFMQFVEFDGHLFALSAHGCLVRIPNVDPGQTPVYDPALNAYGTATRSFRANYNIFRGQVFDDDADSAHLYIGTTASGVGSRMYERASGGAWAESNAFVSVRLERFAVCWWQDEEGVGADRLHVRSSASHEIRHCIKGADPLLEASYTTPIVIGSSESQIQELIAGPRRLFVLKSDGLYDVTPFRAPLLTPSLAQARTLNDHAQALIGRVPGYLFGDHVYFGHGLSVGRYDLRLEGQQQRSLPDCSPSAFAQDGFPLGGCWPTAFVQDGNSLLLALWQPYSLTSYVVRGFPTGAGPDELDVPQVIWHGAEVTIKPSGGVGKMVTAMHAGAINTTSGTALQGIKRYLWLGLLNSNGGTPSIDYAELPGPGGPLSQIMAGGTFVYSPTARLYLTGQNYDDDQANIAVRRIDVASKRASASNFITLYLRSAGDPTTLTTDNTWTSEGTIDSDAEKILPSTVKFGKMIYSRLDWTTASPYTTAAVFESERIRSKVVRELFAVRTIAVILERDYELPMGMPDIRTPDTVFDSVTALQDLGQQTFVDEHLRSYSVLVEQGIQFSRAEIGEGQWRTVANLELSVVSGPS